jgi:hypothetical protein
MQQLEQGYCRGPGVPGCAVIILALASQLKITTELQLMTHTRTSPRRWPRRLLLLLPGTLAALLLLLAGALLILDDTDYKHILEWATDTFLDSDLVIGGPFSVRLSDGIHVMAGDVQLRAHDGSYSVSANEFSTQFRVVSIFSGALVINDLVLADAHLWIEEMENGRRDNQPGIALPPVVIASAHFKNLTLEYQEAQPGTLHSFSLSELVVDGINDAAPLDIRASGLFEGQNYELNGRLPPLADMLVHDRPHPVKVLFSSDRITASLDGQVADFLKGQGLDMKLELHTSDAREIFEIFTDGVPRVGDLDATARLYGDYDSPGLDDIDASFQRDNEVAVRITGKVDDIMTGKGLELDISGQSSQPTVASWLMFGRLDRVRSLSLDAKLLSRYGRLQLHDVKASASSTDGLELVASGNAELYDSGHVFAASDTGLTVQFSAPTTAAFNLLEYKGLPELGAVKGTLRLLASRDAVGLYDVEARIGNRHSDQLTLQGSVARIELQDEAAITGIDLRASLSTADVAAMAKLAGYEIPQLGQGRADLRASGDLDKLRLSDVNISMGGASTLQLTAKGSADRLNLTSGWLPEIADFSVTASIPQLADLSGYVGVNLPALGLTRATGQLTLRGKKLEFAPAKVTIGKANQPAIRLDGKATTVLDKGSSIDVRFDMATTDLVMAFTDMKPGYLGRLDGSFSLSSMAGSWLIEKFQLTSAQTQLYQIEIAGEREDFNKTDLASVKMTFAIRDPAALGEALNIDLSGVSPWSSKGVLSTEAKTLSFRASGTLGSTASTTRIEGFLKNGKPHFKGSMDIPVLYLRDLGFGKPPQSPATQPVQSRPDRNYLFSREPLNVSSLQRFGLDFELRVSQVESHGELSIDSVNSKISVRDGVLDISPMTLIFEGGKMDVQFRIDTNGVPAYSLRTSGDDIVLGPLMAQVQDDVPITGYSNLDMDLRARGKSPHELVSSLNGDLSLGFENAKIPSKYIDLLSVDVFGWVFSKTKKKESYANLNCVVVAFDIEAGQMRSRTLIADGPDLTVAGHVNLDLNAETMDILLIPKQKKRLFSSIEPVKIRGPMLDPKVEAIPVKAAIQEAGAMALLPTVVIPVRLLGKLWSLLDDGDGPGAGCANLKTVTDEAEIQLEK